MKTLHAISKILNIIALLFLLLGPYGLVFTGGLQVLAATVFLISDYRNKLTYAYFITVGVFFILWNGELETWLFVIPLVLIIYLSFIIHGTKIYKKYCTQPIDAKNKDTSLYA